MKFILLFIISSLFFIQIESASKADKVVSFAKSKIGCGYIWSGEGQVLTQALMNQLHNQYPDNVDTSIVKKWIGKQVYDCSGLVMKAFKEVGINLIHNAQYAWSDTKWAKKGAIANYPRDKVCILYKYSYDRKKMTHTGIYIGGNRFIHAKSSKDGVVMETMPYSWTHFGIPAGLY